MDGKGRYLDNIFVERLWRSLKYEEIYLHAYDSLTEAREGIGRYFRFYNDARPHTSLGYQPPAAFYDSTPRCPAAMSALVALAPGAGVLDRRQVPRSAPTPLRRAPAATSTQSPRTGVGQLGVPGPGPGLQPRSYDTTTTRTDPAGSTLATPDFGPKDGVHLKRNVTGLVRATPS